MVNSLDNRVDNLYYRPLADSLHASSNALTSEPKKRGYALLNMSIALFASPFKLVYSLAAGVLGTLGTTLTSGPSKGLEYAKFQGARAVDSVIQFVTAPFFGIGGVIAPNTVNPLHAEMFKETVNLLNIKIKVKK